MDVLSANSSIFLASLIVLLGAMIQGSVGIGLGFVAVPLLVLINPDYVPGPLLLAALTLTILISVREHQSIESSHIKWAVIGRAAGTFIAVIILSVIPQGKMSLLFGLMILLAVIISLLGYRVPLNKPNLFGTGTLSGIMGTTSAIGGVAMAIIYQDYDGPRLRGTLSGIFVIGTIISILALFLAGKFGWKEIRLSGVLIPGIVAGYFISNKTSKVLDRGMIRPIVLTIAAFAGIVVIGKNLIN